MYFGLEFERSVACVVIMLAVLRDMITAGSVLILALRLLPSIACQ